MNIGTKLVGDKLIATLSGRLDSLTAPEFDAWFGDRLAAGDNRLILDLTALNYISSAGLRSLLAAAKQSKTVSGKIVLCGLSGTVAEVFTMSGFLTIFTVVATPEEALRAMG